MTKTTGYLTTQIGLTVEADHEVAFEIEPFPETPYCIVDFKRKREVEHIRGKEKETVTVLFELLDKGAYWKLIEDLVKIGVMRRVRGPKTNKGDES